MCFTVYRWSNFIYSIIHLHVLIFINVKQTVLFVCISLISLVIGDQCIYGYYYGHYVTYDECIICIHIFMQWVMTITGIVH